MASTPAGSCGRHCADSFPIMLNMIPLTIGFAMLRYRLWDIDVLINRTLVYGVLTVLLAFIYGSLVIGLQILLRELFSQTNDVAIIISTLVIAVVFHPLRRRIQKGIDRRFYRRKYDATKTWRPSLLACAYATTLS